MATITPVSSAGGATAVLTFASASGGGDTIAAASGKQVVLLVNNADASSKTVTLAGVVPCSQGSTHNVATSVAAGKTAEIPVPPQCIDPTTGNVAVTYSAVTSVTVAATTN